MPQILCLLLMCFIATLQLTFMTLFTIGGFQVNPAHLSFLALMFVFAGRNIHDFLALSSSPYASRFVVLYALYLMAILLSMFTGHTKVEDLSLLAKYAIYFAVFCGLFTILNSNAITDRSITIAVYGGCFAGIFVFLSVSTVILLTVGRNFPLEFFSALLHLDANALRFRIFLPILNYTSAEIDRNSGAFVSLSRINTLMGGGVLALQLVWIYRRAACRYLPKSLATFLLWFVTLTSVFLVLGSTSRTNIAAMLASLLVVSTGQFNSPQHAAQRTNIALLSVIVMTLVLLAAIVSAPFIGFDELIAERFGTSVISGDSRFPQYTEALEKIKRRPLAGYGLGAQITVPGVGTQHTSLQVHNLLIAAWYEIGITGFFTAFAFYGYLMIVWWREISNNSSSLQRFFNQSPSSVWFLSLPCLPALRAIFAGQGGNFSLVEWICLAFFFSILLRLRQRVGYRVVGTSLQ